MVEGEPSGLSEEELESLAEALHADSEAVVRAAAVLMAAAEAAEGGEAAQSPRPLELSVVLCDDATIRRLNLEWRGKDEPTDVLSFEMGAGAGSSLGFGAFDDEDEDEEGSEHAEVGAAAEQGEEQEEGEEEEEHEEGEELGVEDDEWDLPVTLLGDVVVSLDTATRQAAERRHSLRDECRVLLVHGLLHLLGYDHELGEEEEAEMAEAEARLLRTLGWQSDGLIAAAAAAAERVDGSGDGGRGSSVHAPADSASTSGTAGTPAAQSQQRAARLPTKPEIKLLALDMDGTLLDSRSRVLPSSVAAIRAALARGVTVMLATGKARPAAIRAMQAVGLAGEGLVVSERGPGVFLQGLTAYGRGGVLVTGGALEPGVVARVFEYAGAHGIPVCGFLGEECVTLALTEELEELHHRYYEPLARVAGSIEEVLAGPPVRKMLFMTEPHVVEGKLKPHWSSALEGMHAEAMQAVPEMLEVVPSGWNKARALRALLSHLEVPADAFMAVGDGGNDLSMVQLAGVGVAMGNAVPEVKAAAGAVVASNDDDGVAEAIERFIL